MKLRKESYLKLFGIGIALLTSFSVGITTPAATLPEGAFANAASGNEFSLKEKVGDVQTPIAAYTLNDFKSDFAAAQYTAFEDFESETNHNGNTINYGTTTSGTAQTALYTFNMKVTGVDNATFPLRIYNPYGDGSLYMMNDTSSSSDFSSGTTAVYRHWVDGQGKRDAIGFDFPDEKGSDTYNVIKVDNEPQNDYKITAFGAVIHQLLTAPMDFLITLDDGSEVLLKAATPSSGKVNRFLGYKAPTGKYISKVTIGGSAKQTAIDDIGIIFEKVERVADHIEIYGKELVQTPPYGVSGSKYQYKAIVVDQFGAEMENEEVTLNLTGGNSSISFDSATGILEVTKFDGEDQHLTFTAQPVSNDNIETVTKNVTVENVSYYYNERLISSAKKGEKVGETTAEREENDRTGDEALTRAEFVSLLDTAIATEGMDMTIMNFVSDAFEVTDQGVATMPLHKAGKNLTMSTAGKKMVFRTVGDDGVEYSSNGTVMSNPSSVLPTAGNKFYYLQSPPQGGNEFIINTSALGNLRVTSMGFVMLAGGTLSVDDGFRVKVTYSNGKIGYFSQNIAQSPEIENNVFFGIKAPDGHSITKLEITTNSGNKNVYAKLDEFGFVFEELSPVATTVKIEGPDKVQTPPYGVSSSKYQYKAIVVDQFGAEMASERATLSLSGANSYISFDSATGILSVAKFDEQPPQLIFTAQAVSDEYMTATKNVPVEIVPFYNPSLISSTKTALMVGETTAERDENDTTGDALLSRDEFVSLLDTAIATDGMDMAMMNFDSDEFKVSTSGVATMPLHKSGKIFSMATAARRLTTRTVRDDGGEYSSNGSLISAQSTVVPTAGGTFYYLQSLEQGGNELIMKSEGLGDLRVTAMGLVMLSHTALSVKNGFRIIATYSNGERGYFSTNLASSPKEENNVFFGIKAPVGHYITNVEIITAQNKPTTFSKADEFGFVFEVPDIINIEKDYSQLQFSDISDEDMQNITKDLNLTSFQTIGTSTVSWSTTPDGIIAQDGTLTPPEAPDEKGNTPLVNLKATFSSGTLTKERIFELFVPSKLEKDRDAISVPTEASGDITLPTTGSLYGSAITWSAGANSPIDTSSGNLGKVSRPDKNDKYVLLTATISNPSGSVTKNFGVTVKALNPDTSGGGNGGGGGGGGGAIAAPTIIPQQKEPVEVKPAADADVRDSVFRDLSTQHWAYGNIKELYEKGIVNGTSASTFDPEGRVTREQYLAMLVRAFRFESEKTDVSFTDVSEDAWYYDAVLTAQKLGITDGYADGSFGIGKNITREEMAVMAYRSAQAAGISFKEEGVDAVWNDSEEISEFAADAIRVLNENGIINGMSENEFSPRTTSTRAQATVIISRLLGVNTIE